jgi:hypothetical protein
MKLNVTGTTGNQMTLVAKYAGDPPLPEGAPRRLRGPGTSVCPLPAEEAVEDG